MQIASLDHLVLTVSLIFASRGLYCSALGMEVLRFPEGQKALVFGRQKIKLHQYGKEFGPRANSPATGSAGLVLCLNGVTGAGCEPLRGASLRNL